jgi:general secretion pathway protein L
MHILSIDVGSYSVKYISSYVDRRKVSHVEMSEVVVKDYLTDHSELSLQQAQAAIVQEIIELASKPDTRIIFQANNEMMTTRFITLPVKSKKKAELMLPFQLEEDIPHALSEIHYAYRLDSLKNQFVALAELTKIGTFEEFFNTFKDKNSLPNILTTEASILDSYFSQTPVAGPFCVLDLGHRTSKCYFFYNSRLLVSHVSYVGGQQINEMISKSYQIDVDEAVFYKHQNAFVLTRDQFSEVDSNQQEFAHAMDLFFSPLIADFTRWKIGFKVNFGLNVNNVYICGGTANVKNIANYLSEKWDLKVSHLETFDKVEGEKVDLNPKNKSKYALVNMMAMGFKKKNRLINLLIGKFAQASITDLPLHSLAFISVRVASVTALLFLSLLVERIFIQQDIQFINGKLTSILKDDTLAISGRIRRSAVADPKPLLDNLTKRQRSVRQEVSTLQSALETEALSPLIQLSQLAASTQATLTHLKTNDVGDISATFIADNMEEINKLKEIFEKSSLSDLELNIDASKIQLKISTGK